MIRADLLSQNGPVQQLVFIMTMAPVHRFESYTSRSRAWRDLIMHLKTESHCMGLDGTQRVCELLFLINLNISS